MLLFLPAAGLRRQSTGNVDNIGTELSCWSMDAHDSIQARRMCMGTTSVNVRNGIARGFGFSIRLATVVSGLAGEMSSVPACCGV